MAFPVVESTTPSTDLTDSTTYSVSMPATVASGDLLLIVCTVMLTGTTITLTEPTGWTEIVDNSSASGPHAGIFAKISDGTEGGGSVTVTANTTCVAFAATTLRISGFSGTIATDIDVQTTTKTISANPNPAAVTAGWGSDDNLFIAVAHYIDDAGTVSGYPTNYSGSQTNVVADGGVNNSACVGLATRNLAADTDDPGTFTLSELEGWNCSTLVIKPAAAGGGTTLQTGSLMMMNIGI